MDRETKIKMAIVTPVPTGGGPAKVAWRDAGDFSHAQTALPQFQYVKSAERLKIPSRIVENNYQTWLYLSEFFNYSRHDIYAEALCETSGADTDSYTMPFIKARLGLHDHLVFARGSKHLLSAPKAVEKVHFVSGLCLFSDKHLKAVSSDGTSVNLLNPRITISKAIASITAVDELSFYELESGARLARLLSDISLCLPQNLPFDITLDIPLVQYYVYLLDAYQHGLVSRDLLLHWFEMVKARHRMASIVLKNLLVYWFEKAGKQRDVNVNISDGMGSVDAFIVEQVIAGRQILPGQLTERLSAIDPAWKSLNELMQPKTFLDVTFVSYSLEQMRANLQNRSDVANSLTIAVDNREEQRIYEGSLKIMSKLRAAADRKLAPLLAIYPLEHFLVVGTQNWGMYNHDPGNEFIDDSGRRFTAEEILDFVYDNEAELGGPISSYRKPNNVAGA